MAPGGCGEQAWDAVSSTRCSQEGSPLRCLPGCSGPGVGNPGHLPGGPARALASLVDSLGQCRPENMVTLPELL